MHGRHLTRKGSAWVFQMRVPTRFDFPLQSSPIRITLGAIPKRVAQVTARVLAVSASIHFERARFHNMAEGVTRTPDHRWNVASLLRDDFAALMPFLRGLDDVDRCQPTDATLGRRMIAAGLDGLADLFTDRMTGGSLARNQGAPLESYFRKVITDEGTGREHLGEPPLPPPEPTTDIARVLSVVTAMQTKQVAMEAKLAVATAAKRGPLFSFAADAYYEKLRLAHGDGYDELKYLLHRKAVFLQLCVDKPISEYTQEDFQHFVNEVRHLPPNVSKEPDYRIENVRRYIADAKAGGTKGLSESTLVNNYVGKIKTILRDGCASAGIPFTLDDMRIVLPKGVPKARHRLAPDYAALNRVFCIGAESGMLAEVMLPLVGFLTGRRLGLLTFLRREDIQRYHDCWVVPPRDSVWDGNRWVTVPFKTEESLTYFVLHDVLAEIGFIDWARSGQGFLFESLHEAKDPADTASKRMARLFRQAGLDPRLFNMFHGLRHAKIALDRELKVDPRTIRLQIGHELGGVHENYGDHGMNRSELAAVARVELPLGIDLSVFHDLDFEALAAARPRRGRPRKDI
jgi:integrase